VNIIRNLFALIGFVVTVGIVFLAIQFSNVQSEFDPQAPEIYKTFAMKLLESKDAAIPMVWKFPVNEGIDAEQVKESMKSIAVQRGMFFAGESPFYKQVEAITGSPYRHVSFLNFCDAMVGKQMADYNDAYTAMMPCTISVVQDKSGKLAIYSMNMDLLIYGGKTLPDELKKSALKVRGNMLAIMEGAAKGEF
jgi:uncharacterized protein (DUF302 family)